MVHDNAVHWNGSGWTSGALPWLRRAELAQERANRPAKDGTSAQQQGAAHRAEVAAAAAEAAQASREAHALRDALAARDAELQRLQVSARRLIAPDTARKAHVLLRAWPSQLS